MPPSRLTSLLAALAVLLLTACAAEEEPTPIFAEPTATPTLSAEAAPKDPHRSPKAAIRHWNELSNTMQSGDTSEWRAFTRGCEPCNALTKRIEEIYANGGYVKTEGQSIQSIKRESVHDLTTVYLVDVHSAPTELRPSQNEPVQLLDGGQATLRLHLEDNHGRWSVANYTQAAR